jgi:predicted O-methyltransferase YrrM
LEEEHNPEECTAEQIKACHGDTIEHSCLSGGIGDRNMERLADINPPVEDRGKFLREIAMGFEKGQIFLTALELDLFTELSEPKTGKALSADMGTHLDITRRFLDVLVALGVLAKHNDQYRTAPDVAPFLIEGELYSARYLKFSTEERECWMKLKQVLKEGPLNKPAHNHEHDYDRDSIDWIARGTMLGRLQATLKIVSELPEFENANRLIDLGGGHGLFGIGFAQENPQLEVVIFDQPGVTDITQDYINKYGMQYRVKTMTGDYTKDSIGSNYDIAFEACSFGGKTDESKSFYQRVSNALNENGLFITQTFTIDDDRTAPLSSLIWDLKEQMTGHSHMHIRTNAELFEIFEETGLVGERVIDMSESFTMPTRMIIARKKL